MWCGMVHVRVYFVILFSHKKNEILPSAKMDRLYAIRIYIVQDRECSQYFIITINGEWGFPDGSVVKNLPANTGDIKDTSSIPESGKMPWRRKWQPTPVFLPGEFYRQRNLKGYIVHRVAESRHD